jgi:delta 1-pyrroline-5-carboxylate dehydrogenase
MEHGYFTHFAARTIVAEKLNHSRREQVILDRIEPVHILGTVIETVTTAVQRFIKNVDRELQRWAGTQTACTWRNLSLANC